MNRSFSLTAAALLATACLSQDPVEVQIPECRMAAIDTTGWQRVREFQAEPGHGFGGGADISYLVPPSFRQTGTRTWERGGTRVHWEASFAGPPPAIPWDDYVYRGSCTARVANTRVSFDLGELRNTGAVPELALLAGWSNVPLRGTSGSVLFDARMKDHSDRFLVERMLWSLVIHSGPSGPGQ